MATLATLAAQRWRLLICGLRHGRSVEALQHVLEEFQPAAIFLELDREDFHHLRSCRRDHYTDAAPEVSEVIRWAEQRQCPLTPLDRPQLCTRRRLAQQMALGNPMQLYAVRRYWGEMPQDLDAMSWRAKLQRDCPILHEVMLEERDEFMTYRILLALERRLAQRSVKGQSLNSGALGLPALLEQRAALEKQRLNEAMSANQSRSTIRGSPWENVLVLCGPAHVKELQRRLQFALSDPHFSPRFLATNAALLPHLWRNQSDQPPQMGDLGDLGDLGDMAAKTQELLEETETKVAEAKASGFGPLTMLADQATWRKLTDKLPHTDCNERAAPALAKAGVGGTIPDEPVIDIHDHVKEAMEKMKEEEESDTEMKEELPEESPQLAREEEDKIFNEVEVDEEAEEIEADASGMRRKMQYEKEEQDAINANTGVTSSPIDADDATGTAAPATVVEPDVSDPIMTLHVEQFSVIEDVQISLSQKVRQWDFRTRILTEEMSRCLDLQRRASMIMDLQVGCAIRDIYNVFYLRYVGGHPDSVEQFFRQKPSRRPDIDGDYPFYGVDEDGNYADPPDEATLIDWADKHWQRFPKEFVWTAYRGALFFKKLIQYSLACGLKREDFQAEFGSTQADKTVLTGGDEREKLQARSKALNDLERQSEFVHRQSLNSGAPGLPALLEQRAALEKQRLNEATSANQSRSTIRGSPCENVLVLCGPAHVKDLPQRYGS
eukprot:s1708_g3.t1